MSDQSLQQLLVTNFGLLPSGYTGSQGIIGFTGSGAAEDTAVVQKIARLEERYSSGTSVNYLTGGSWGTRRLNTVMYDDHGIVTALSSYRFTLGPGTYYFDFSAFAFKVDSHQVRIQNITDGTTVVFGPSFWSDSGEVDVGHNATGRGRVVITSPKVFELQHYVATTSSGPWGNGHPTASAQEQYAGVEIYKESLAVGYTGSQGEVGLTGSQGEVGPIGYTGSRGAYDAVGFTGSAGTGGGGGATGGGTNQVFYENDQTVTDDYTITSGKNAMTAGPVSINTGVVVTVPTGSTWVIV
jgi:hypothetical protein